MFIISTLWIPVFAQAHQQIIDSVVIKTASWTAVTDIAVECNSFENAIEHQIYTESDCNIISKLVNELNKLIPSSKGGEDIRCKLAFYHSGEIIRYVCIGNIFTKEESNYFYTTPILRAIIDSVANNPKTKSRKGDIETWDPASSVQKICQYIGSQSDRLYNNLKIEEDLIITVFCYVSEEGKTQYLRISHKNNSRNNKLPTQIESVIKEILCHEIEWDIPTNYHARWIPITLSIHANVSK